MKFFKLIFLIFAGLTSYAQKGDYDITINGEKFSIDLDKEQVIKNQKGESVRLRLTQKDTLLYTDDFIEFKYLKGYSVNKTEIDQGIFQLTILSANGNGFLVQEYDGFNPTKIVDIMLDELTKESTNYGYVRKDEDKKVRLADGMFLEGKKAILTYMEETNSYTVLTYGKKDSGILVALIFTNAEEEVILDKQLVDLFMRTFKIKK